MKQGSGSKRKGAAFELLVAAMIRKAIKLKRKDVYRTPMSGGHPFADAGDLVLSERAASLFPYCVECKHRRTWRLGLGKQKADMRAWKRQACEAARNTKHAGLTPLLVIRGNATEIYCALPAVFVPAHLRASNHVAFEDGWALFLFTEFLKLTATANRMDANKPASKTASKQASKTLHRMARAAI